ncbi:MAG: PhzF family phenazine biosynthesis protein [Candidatus Sulfotelmatobacter sp.]
MMSKACSYRYHVVDVFTDRPLEGNSLAVFSDATGLDDITMAKIARELNLSETTFVFSSVRKDCAARVQIFTPRRELDFAGHPTIGTGFVLLHEGKIAAGIEHVCLEENVGPVPIRIQTGERTMIWLRTPPIEFGRCYDPMLCANVLGLTQTDMLEIVPQLVSAGNPTVLIAVRNKEAVDRAWLDMGGIKVLKGQDREPVIVFVFAPTPEGAYSRMFAPEYGMPEDPATGSSTGPLAAFMMRHGLISKTAGTHFVSEQGTKMGRRSLLHVEIHGEAGKDGIDVGGHVTLIAEATMSLKQN